MIRSNKALIILAFVLTSTAMPADDRDRLKVGAQPDGSFVVPTNQILRPAGTQVAFRGRPVDMAFLDGGRTVVVKNMKNLVFIDAATGKIKLTLPSGTGARSDPGYSVVGLVVHQDDIFVSDAHDQVRAARRQADGSYKWEKPIQLQPPLVGEEAHPAGMAMIGESHLAVTATRGNVVQFINLATRQVEESVPVGVAPYTILPIGPDCCYVSNWGGDPPADGDPKAVSSGTPIRIDPRTGVANHGSVSVLRRVAGKWKQSKTIPTGLHPSGMCMSKGGRYVFVANAASDTVSVINTRTEAVVETIDCRPEARLPFGSGSNAVALSPDGATLYVANGTNNCVAVVRLGNPARDDGNGPDRSKVAGQIPVGWYPGAILVSADGKRLFVANIKGHGTLSQPRAKEKGMNSHDHFGTVSLIDLPDEAALAKDTERVNANNRLAYSLAGLEKPRPGVAPKVVPERHGEPSVIEHVVYVIKENRTYDQVFGDMKGGNGDPKLCIFGEEVTPNHHAIARQFTLLDNFYCSGVLSADGHCWVTEAYVTDYLEKAFGGFTRSYPDDGSDPLAYQAQGFIWDNALAHKKTVRNYGEFVKNEYIPKTATWKDCYQDFLNGTQKVQVKSEANVPGLKPYTHAGFPWFPLMMPDVYRAKLFIDDLAEFEKKGQFPNLALLTLPCDHTEGTSADFPTPRAMVADNDLALGRVVEALTKSKFWPKMCILVVEDDPQNGYDHVDGHRTVAFAISPYTKRKHVDSTCYNQTGMVKTIEMMLGLPPLNQLDLSATPMRGCFQEKPDLTPYTAIPNKIPLDEMNKPAAQLKGMARYWAMKSRELNKEVGDMDDEDTLNRIIWFSVRGNAPYPGDTKWQSIRNRTPFRDLFERFRGE